MQTFKRFLRQLPPSASQHNWRKGSNLPINNAIFVFPAGHLAEGVCPADRVARLVFMLWATNWTGRSSWPPGHFHPPVARRGLACKGLSGLVLES